MEARSLIVSGTVSDVISGFDLSMLIVVEK